MNFRMSISPGTKQRASIFDTLQLVQVQAEANRVMQSTLSQSLSARSAVLRQENHAHEQALRIKFLQEQALVNFNQIQQQRLQLELHMVQSEAQRQEI